RSWRKLHYLRVHGTDVANGRLSGALLQSGGRLQLFFLLTEKCLWIFLKPLVATRVTKIIRFPLIQVTAATSRAGLHHHPAYRIHHSRFLIVFVPIAARGTGVARSVIQ